MMTASGIRRLVLCSIVLLAAGLALPAGAVEMTNCTMEFDLKGWSAIYKHAEGEGVIACDNGQKAEVEISVKGGGLTVGKSRMLDATGTFSEVKDIEETFGSYAAVGAEAGAVKSSEAMALTKGEISLAIAGTGQGFDLGVSGTKFTIKRKK